MNRQEEGNGRWRKIPILGMPAFAAFLICVVTGVLLVPVYEPNLPFDSIALLLLKNPAGTYVRSLHYWSAQAFLVFTLLHLLEHLFKRSETKVAFGIWVRLSLSVPAAVGVVLSGFLLRGDVAAPSVPQGRKKKEGC
jgi:quinol-cytochrome oxidoreductase complex cytochrome b subunit